MKVLMVNSPGAVRFRGGDLVQMRKTAAALKSFGVDVTESLSTKPETAGFDLAHVFNLRTLDSTYPTVTHLKKAGLPVVLSPIYLNPSLALWATRMITTFFRAAKTNEELDRLLTDLKNHTLKAKLADGTVMTADSPNRPRPDYDSLQKAILAQVDYLLPNSVLEMHHLMRTLRVCDRPFTVVPYATDPLVFLDPDPRPFVHKYGIRDFVLQVGRIEPSKNQLLLAYAMREVDLPLVLIGGNLQRGYLEWCKKHGPKGMKILPHLSPAELRSAYAAARVHILPSWMETCGMVTMEAALANCNVVCSVAGFEIEFYKDFAYYCDPADVGSIRTTVIQAFKNYHKDAPRRLELKQRILSEYTWPKVAETTFKAYRRVLEAK